MAMDSCLSPFGRAFLPVDTSVFEVTPWAWPGLALGRTVTQLPIPRGPTLRYSVTEC